MTEYYHPYLSATVLHSMQAERLIVYPPYLSVTVLHRMQAERLMVCPPYLSVTVLPSMQAEKVIVCPPSLSVTVSVLLSLRLHNQQSERRPLIYFCLLQFLKWDYLTVIFSMRVRVEFDRTDDQFFLIFFLTMFLSATCRQHRKWSFVQINPMSAFR